MPLSVSLVAGLREMIANSRLSESTIPDDFQWLLRALDEAEQKSRDTPDPECADATFYKAALAACKQTLAEYQAIASPHDFIGDISLKQVHALINKAEQSDTPAAQWRENSEEDSHGDRYDRPRAGLDALSAQMRALIAEAVKALEPFAGAAERINYYDGEQFNAALFASRDGNNLRELLDGVDGQRLMVTHLREAAATLAKLREASNA